MTVEIVQPGTSTPNDTGKRLRVMMITEGNYPYHWGGVSTWCHILMNELPEIDFVLYTIIDDSALPQKFSLPKNVVEFHSQALWNCRQQLENRPKLGARELWRIRRSITAEDIVKGFLPDFRAFMINLFTGQEPAMMQAKTLHRMHRFFLEYDFDTTMRSRAVWRCFMEIIREYGRKTMAERGYPRERISLAEATRAMQWLYHWLMPLGRPVPRVDVAHSAMAGLCTLVAVMAKLEYGSAFLLTEHGVYMRERYFFEGEKSGSLFLKCFSLFFSRRMTELTYGLADLVAPCCDYNQRWELRMGVEPARLKTIYYGLDSTKFSSNGKPPNDPLVVVWMGRIDPLKDLFTLLQAAALVHEARPDIQFRLFGSAPPGNEKYNEQCLTMRRELGLEETVHFAGFRSDTVNAYNEGDIFVLSSKSEAFPFVNLEAMLCERPVVSSAVGGVPEQLEGCGFAVEPRNPRPMADAILQLAADPELRATFGRDGRRKVMTEYSIQNFASEYSACYHRLASQAGTASRALTPLDAAGMASAGAFVPEASTPAELRSKDAASLPGNVPPMVDRQNGSTKPGANGRVGSMTPAWMSAPTRPRSPASIPPTGGERRGDAETRRRGDTGTSEVSAFEAAASASPHLPVAVSPRLRVTASLAAPVVVTPQGISTLVAEVTSRDPKPIDAMEVTALLEAQGVTDPVARQRYGFPTTFELGEAVLAQMQQAGVSQMQEQPQPAESEEESALKKWFDYVRGPLSLLPVFLILLIISALTAFAQWGYPLIIALTTGMTGSMIMNSGLLQSAGRRMSIYMGASNNRLAHRFLMRATLLSIGLDLAAALLVAGMLALTGIFSPQQIQLFLAAFVGLGWLWLLGGELALVGKAWWLGGSLGLGLVIGIITGVLVVHLGGPAALLAGRYLAWAFGVGYTAALALLIYGLSRLYTGPDAKAAAGVKPRLPSLVYLVDEALPYFLYGAMYMVFILIPHLVGLAGRLPAGMERANASAQLEIVLTLTMLPMAIANGINERALRLFWKMVPKMAVDSPISLLSVFQKLLLHYAEINRRNYLRWLIVISLEIDGIFILFLSVPAFSAWLNISSPWQMVLLFQVGLVAYGLLSQGVYNAMYSLTLGSPTSAVWSILSGLLAILGAGITASLIDYRLSAVAFLIGAAIFYTASRARLRVMIDESAYHLAFSI